MEDKRQAARAARARQDSEDVEEMDPSPSSGGFDREQELAATKIQSRIRGKHARCVGTPCVMFDLPAW